MGKDHSSNQLFRCKDCSRLEYLEVGQEKLYCRSCGKLLYDTPPHYSPADKELQKRLEKLEKKIQDLESKQPYYYYPYFPWWTPTPDYYYYDFLYRYYYPTSTTYGNSTNNE